MAITTDITYEVKYNGTTVDEIGQSKTLNLLTSAEIEDFLYCGCYNNTMSGNLYPYTTDAGSYDTWNSLNDKYMPFKTDAVTGTYMQMLPGGGAYNDTTENGRYVGVVLVVDTTGEGYVNSITQSNASRYRIITEFDARNYYLAHTGNFTQVDGYGATDWEDENAGLYNYDYTGEVLHYVYKHDNTETDINLYGEINIFPYAVFVDGNDLLYLVKLSSTILQLSFKAHIATNYNAGYCLLNFTGNNATENSLSITYNCLNFGTSFTDNGDSSYNWPYPSTHDVYKYHKTDKDFVGRTHFQYHDFETAYWFTKLEQLLWLFAAGGLKFKCNDIMYKPLISNNVVYGYTDDMAVESELDSYTGSTKHDIPVTPPSPPTPSGDDPSDPQSWGGAYSGAGAFSKFYLCTATDLANLRTWFGGGGSGDPIPDGFDPMGQVLGLLQYPVSISGTALAAEEIVFRSGKTIVHTNVNATRSTGGFLHIDCGSVEIPRRMQERGVPFLDFETSLEIYVPFCGTAPLDVQTCVGKTLTCDMYVATATGDVSAVIAAGGHPVAYMSGNMAESLPISSSGYGMYLAACKSTWGNGVSQVMNQLTGGTTDTLKNVNQAALNETLSYNQTGGWGRSELIAESYNNPKIGSAMAAAAGPLGAAAIGLIKTGLNVANAASTSYEQYQRVKHASYTSVSGSFTSCAAWNYPFTPYVKITRPHKQIPTGGRGDYKHTSAIPLVETKTLSGAPGLTTCVNPDVSGISNATAQEKDIIYRALVNGVIV